MERVTILRPPCFTKYLIVNYMYFKMRPPYLSLQLLKSRQTSYAGLQNPLNPASLSGKSLSLRANFIK